MQEKSSHFNNVEAQESWCEGSNLGALIRGLWTPGKLKPETVKVPLGQLQLSLWMLQSRTS